MQWNLVLRKADHTEIAGHARYYLSSLKPPWFYLITRELNDVMRKLKVYEQGTLKIRII